MSAFTPRKQTPMGFTQYGELIDDQGVGVSVILTGSDPDGRIVIQRSGHGETYISLTAEQARELAQALVTAYERCLFPPIH